MADRIARTKLNRHTSHPKSRVPYFRSKPNNRFLKYAKDKFNRSRAGIHKLCPDKDILTPAISSRLFKTLQRSTLLYAIELCDWDGDQVAELETLQAKTVRVHYGLDNMCPKSIVRLISGVEPFDARIDLHVLKYYAKLYRSDPKSFLGKIHRYRVNNINDIPVGFYHTAYRTLKKYGMGHLWNNMPTKKILHQVLKKTIWLYHWRKDVSNALLSNSIFSIVFLSKCKPPAHPYKCHTFLSSLNTMIFPRSSLSRVLRFWLTPPRERHCSCGVETGDLAKHLLFFCSQTRATTTAFVHSLEDNLAACFKPSLLTSFLEKIVKEANILENFNLMIGTFDYPRY